MKIGEISKRVNMPSSTIRYYEKMGLIDPPERVSGIRQFDSSTLLTLRFIQLCQAAGFTINEVKGLLANPIEDSTEAKLWQPAVEIKRTEIQERINELKKADEVLGELMECTCEAFDVCVENAYKDSRWPTIGSE